MSGLLMQPSVAAGPYGVREIGSKSASRAHRPSVIHWFSDPVLSTVCPLPRSLRPAAHTSRQLPCFRFSPFAARSGGSANPVGLLSRGQRPDPPRRPVRERHRDQHLRLACQHPGQPRIRDLAAPARVPNNGHGSRDQEPPQIALAQHPQSGADTVVIIELMESASVIPANLLPSIGVQVRDLRRLRIACLSCASSGCW